MLKEEKIFNGGGINSDDAVEYMSPNDLMDAFNIRIQSTESNKQGYVTPIEGNRQVAHNLPTGVNKVVGAKYFTSTKRVYLFVENNSGRFRIDEFNAVDKTFTKVFEDMTDTGGNRLIPSQTVLIKDIELIGGKLLFWNHFPQDKVFNINVEMAKSGEYGIVDKHDLSLRVSPPSIPPSATAYRSYGGESSSLGYNNTKGKMFQFRYRFIYKDGRASVWSAYSNRVIPNAEVDADGNVVYSDMVGVRVDYGTTTDINWVEISARDGNSPWYTIKRVKREDILSMSQVGISEEIPNPSPPPATIHIIRHDEEGRLPFSNLYYYPFFNDGLYPQDDQLEHDLLYDVVPESVRALGSVNGNTLLLGNVKHGRDKPDLGTPGINTWVTLEDPGIEVVSPSGWRMISQNLRFGGLAVMTWEALFEPGTVPQTGDVFSMLVYNSVNSDPPPMTSWTYTVTGATSGNLEATLNAMASQINTLGSYVNASVSNPGWVVGGSVISPNYKLTINSSQVSVFSAAKIRSAGTQNVAGKVVPTNKLGASYEVAIGWYTEEGEPFPLYTSDRAVVRMPTYTDTRGLVPVINWEISSQAPVGAAYYHVLSSSNRTHEASWYAVVPVDGDSTPSEFHFNLNGLLEYHKEFNGGQPMYEYVPGDYINVIANVEIDSSLTNWENPKYTAQDVSNLETIVDDTDPNNPITKLILKTSRSTYSNIVDTKSVLIEIVRPKRAESDTKVFYEVSKRYPVQAGVNTVTSGTIEFTDSFAKIVRTYDPLGGSNTTRDVFVDSFYFSDSYKSNYTNFGRPRVDFDVPNGLTHFKTDVLWSGEYNSVTGRSELNRFYPENTYRAGAPYFGPTEDYGGIQYLSNRENRLLCLQESKVGYIPVNRAIISDSVEQQQISISQDLLNPINYSIGPNIGIGNDYCIPSYSFIEGSAYFIDPVERAPVRAGLDGTRYIYFKAESRLKSRISRALASNQYIRSWWDGRFNEWGVGFNDESFIFNEDSNRWFRAGYIPNVGFTANDQLFTSKDGSLWVHDDAVNVANFYGNDSPITLTAPFVGAYVRTFNSVAVHCDKLLVTTENGVKTQLGHVSDLREEDFLDPDGLSFANEGVWYANFAPDYNTGEIEGDLLKGRYVTLNLTPATKSDRNFRLLKVVVKSTPSTPNE